jgi:hypothetical protein
VRSTRPIVPVSKEVAHLGFKYLAVFDDSVVAVAERQNGLVGLGECQ